MTFTCDRCGALFSRKFNLKRHQTSRCKQSVLMKDDATDAVKENDDQKSKDSRWSDFINDIINKKPESGDATIQPFKSSPMSYAANKTFDISLSKKEPAKEILAGCETAKSLNISFSTSEEKSEDESITEHSLVKKRKLMNTDDGTLMKSEVHHDAEDDNLNQENETIDRNQEDKYESDENDNGTDDGLVDYDDNVIEKGEGGSVNNDESVDNDSKNISEGELKDRLYRQGNNMKVFELNLDADEGLTNINLLKYIEVLKVPKFRGVFMRDELPERPNPVECGIVNLSSHEHLGTHWVCYAKIHQNRIYFDSFGRKTPLEIQYYLKTEEEFRNNVPVIERSTDIVQRPNTKICGQLCLFVLTSLMREHLSFQHVMDQLTYGHSGMSYYWYGHHW